MGRRGKVFVSTGLPSRRPMLPRRSLHGFRSEVSEGCWRRRVLGLSLLQMRENPQARKKRKEARVLPLHRMREDLLVHLWDDRLQGHPDEAPGRLPEARGTPPQPT